MQKFRSVCLSVHRWEWDTRTDGRTDRRTDRVKTITPVADAGCKDKCSYLNVVPYNMYKWNWDYRNYRLWFSTQANWDFPDNVKLGLWDYPLFEIGITGSRYKLGLEAPKWPENLVASVHPPVHGHSHGWTSSFDQGVHGLCLCVCNQGLMWVISRIDQLY